MVILLHLSDRQKNYLRVAELGPCDLRDSSTLLIRTERSKWVNQR